MGLVIYTDGSARPNDATIGNMGCGVHAYLHLGQDKVKSKAIQDYVYTNKGYQKEDNATGVLVKPFLVMDYAIAPSSKGTNNRAEMLAFIHAFEQIYLIFCKDTNISLTHIHHLTDSEYVKKGITEYLPRWAKRNWLDMNGVTISNVDLWVKIQTIVDTMKADGISYTVEWVRGNDTILGNKQADYLSVIGMNYSREHNPTKDFIFESQHTKGYWKNASDRHPMMNFRRMYFNTSNIEDTTGLYFLSDPGDGDMYIGNRNSETGFGVVRLNTPSKVIDIVKRFQHSLNNGQNQICMLNMDKIHEYEVFKDLSLFGKYCLLKSNSANTVLFADNSVISQELNPVRLAPRALTYFSELENILKELRNGSITENKMYGIQDITSEFYDVSEGFMTLKKELVVGYKDHHVIIKRHVTNKANEEVEIPFNIPLQLGVDMPSRNNLKNMEGMSPVIKLITYGVSANSFRYLVYIDSRDGYGVWSNHFTNMIIYNG